MKLLHITNTYAPIGGIETYVIDLLPLLEARGVKNSLIYRNEHPRMPDTNGKPIYHVPVTGQPQRDHAHVSEIIAQEQPDVVYLHDVYDPDLIQLTAGRAPTVGYVHIFYPVCPGLGKLFRRGDEVCKRPYGWGCVPMIYLRRCASARHPASVMDIMKRTRRFLTAYRQLSYVLVASNYMKDLMVQNGFPRQQVGILPYFIPLPEEIEIKEPTPDPDRPGILFAGRLEYEKGLPYLLRALRQIKKPHHLIVAGDGSLKTQYMNMVRELNLSDSVEFIDWLSAEELAAAYRRCAVTVMPSIMPEPFGKVGVEAMANGRPVIGFQVGGIPDWLKDGYNGFLVPSRDVEQLADRLGKILDNPALRDELGQNGREYVQQNYSQEIHLNQLTALLQKSVATGQRRES